MKTLLRRWVDHNSEVWKFMEANGWETWLINGTRALMVKAQPCR